MYRFATCVFLLVMTLIMSLPESGMAQSLGADQFSGQTQDAERKELLSTLTPLVPPDFFAPKAPPAAPGMTFGTPTAFGAGWRQGFVGLSGIAWLDNDVNDNDVDGSMSFGAGFGDASETVGVELSVGIISLTNNFADSGTVGAKIHKIIPDTDGLGVALGWDNVLNWGDAKKAEDTAYVVASKKFILRPEADHQYPLSVSLGVGTGTFRTINDIAADNNDLNLFGSVGVQVLPKLSVASSWTGSQLNVGFGVVPFDSPLAVTIGFNDVTEKKSLGAAFAMNVGYSFSF